MSETVLLGRGREIGELPRQVWAGHLSVVPEHGQTRLAFMTEAHHVVRYFVVSELPRTSAPLTPEFIARRLNLPLPQVEAILVELEQNLFFLVRNEQGAVVWAYPLTVAETPHRVTFDSGEQLYAAWAEDAIAVPFVQGQLWNTPLTVTIETACAHCEEPIRLVLDQALNFEVESDGADPLIFSPHVDWQTFNEPNIIDAYWRNSLFFWSEEHARAFRVEHGGPDGLFLTLAQMAYATPIDQGTLFAFSPIK